MPAAAPSLRAATIPLQMVQQAARSGHELVLLDAGEIRGVVVLDPARQAAWAAAWEAYRPVQREERESRAEVFQMPASKPGVQR